MSENFVTVIKYTILGISIGVAFVVFKHHTGMNM